MAQVHLRGVKKSYEKLEVIHGIDMEIADGEFIVIVGPSGCGKSTLLRMVAGLEKITGGEVAIGDRVVNQLEPKDRDIAMVFQNYALYPHMSVYENMAYGLKIRKLSKEDIDARVRKAAKTLELDKLLDRRPRQLSGGQRQRVAMGRAIVREPAVFLFDEPLSNLDAKLRVQMRLEIKRLQRELGVTSIYVTHDQVEAMTLADRLIVMNAGVADQIGTPMDVYDKPASVFVAGFIGSPAMNFLAAKVGEEGRLVELAATGAGRVALPLGRRSSAAAGTPVAVGLRPEHLRPADDGPLEFEIELAEPLGADTLLHGRFGAARELVTVRQSGHVRAAPGEHRRFAIDADCLHLFDSQTGRRIADA
ncbi:sn-glycerol 3-phosphate transport system ATP-binding protein [Enhydrobacter aerosaccus]|uniref:sn-glycerol 3-phosphate transport system ATP-binding protein n=1 Tax=Enhydrobacter aerosaccus TaxID=225324 RepID=A0A1T4SVM6_9HYPH|nr:sn-glycerol-3-phosphate import ATP-binding protein UgpC [Enhydrobacter aerosaccus]SKA32325.1 sn-glycerol 3-phosphate transport system ATP-binding protein [Enhydrobacter aerosaccus]